MLRELEDLHKRPNCLDHRKTMFFGAPHHGLGGNMHVLSSALTRAHFSKKAMAVVGAWAYGHPFENCRAVDPITMTVIDSEEHGCFFAHYTECPETAHEMEEGEETLIEGTSGGYFWEGPQGAIRDPPPYVHSDYGHHGLLWWRSQLVAFLMRPTAEWMGRVRRVSTGGGLHWPRRAHTTNALARASAHGQPLAAPARAFSSRLRCERLTPPARRLLPTAVSTCRRPACCFWRWRCLQVKNSIGFRSPIVGLHVRHGDACHHGAMSNYRPPCMALDQYMGVVRQMTER